MLQALPLTVPTPSCGVLIPLVGATLRRCGIDEETAARIAREIMGGDTSNPHLAEERGQEVDDSGVRTSFLGGTSVGQ